MTGKTIKGKLADLTSEALQLRVRDRLWNISGTDVKRIQRQQPDSPLTGVLIGAGIGAIPGIYWLIVDPNECTGLCPEDYASIAVGVLVGGLIDRAITKKVTVYVAPERPRTEGRLLIRPLVAGGRAGMHLSLRF